MTMSKEEMPDIKRAERIKSAILEGHTYEGLSEKTGISVSTLTRITANKTEPKLADIVKICDVTGFSLNWITYGTSEEIASPKDQDDDEVKDIKTFRLYTGLENEDKEFVKKIIDSLSIHRDLINRFAKKEAVSLKDIETDKPNGYF